MTGTTKAITSDAGGLRAPLQGFSPSITPEPEQKIHVQEVPRSGLVISPPNMAKAVMDGTRKSIVFTRHLNLPSDGIGVLSMRKALGVATFGPCEKIETEEEFLSRSDEHLVTKELKEEWSEVQSSWSAGPWYIWPVVSVVKFDSPVEVEGDHGAGYFIRDLHLCGEDQLGADLGAEKETKKKTEVVRKIQDAKTYDPSKMDDAQLRDDFRILLAWHASWEKDPDGFEHPLETIESLLRKVIKELVKRGPEAIRFNPAGMKRGSREFFLQVAEEVFVPQEMFKRLALTPSTDPGGLSKAELISAHWDLHGVFGKESEGESRGQEGWSTEDVVNLHAKVIDTLFLQHNTKHPPPPDNGLDELSADFESEASDQPIWHIPPDKKVEKRELTTINRSGVIQGEVVKLNEVLDYFKDFKLRKPYIYLVGGLANHGETEGDIDVLVNDTEDLPAWMRDVIEFRLGRTLPAHLSKRLHVHFDRERGPFTNFVELYDLRAERVNSVNEIKEMSLVEEFEEDFFSDEREKVYAELAKKNWEPDEEDK